MGEWHQLSFCSVLDCLPCCTLAISLIGKSNLLEFLCFFVLRIAFRVCAETMTERTPTRKKGKNHF